MSGLPPDVAPPATVGRWSAALRSAACLRRNPSVDARLPPKGRASCGNRCCRPRASTVAEGQRWGRTILELFYFNMVDMRSGCFRSRSARSCGPVPEGLVPVGETHLRGSALDDDGPLSINYIGHPMSGAAYGMIQRQNHGRAATPSSAAGVLAQRAEGDGRRRAGQPAVRDRVR